MSVQGKSTRKQLRPALLQQVIDRVVYSL
jgi:hypothetical protein